MKPEGPPKPQCYAYDAKRETYACLGYRADNGDAAYPPGKYKRERWLDRPVCGVKPRGLSLHETRWTKLGTARVRYKNDVHEGDASFEFHGSLELGCGGKRFEIDLDPVLRTGPRAVAFTAPAARVHAISVVGEDGGEGVYYYTLQTVLLDDRTCKVALLADSDTASAGD